MISPNIVLEFWPVKQQISNMIPVQNCTDVRVYTTFFHLSTHSLDLMYQPFTFPFFILFYILCLLLCTKTQIQIMGNYLTNNVILIRALVFPSYMPGQYTEQTQVVQL